MKIKKILDKIKEYLTSDTPNSFDFSIELEDLLFEHYDEMKKENAEVTEFLNNELPDICASYDEENEIKFKETIKRQYEKVMLMMT